MTFENDDTPDQPTLAYTNLPLICVNPDCDQFAGEDVSNPRIIIEIVRNQVN